jgi:hypothetical protein
MEPEGLMSDRNRETLEEYSVVVFQIYKQEFRVMAPADDPESAIAAVNADKEHYTGPPIMCGEQHEDTWKVRAIAQEGDNDVV